MFDLLLARAIRNNYRLMWLHYGVGTASTRMKLQEDAEMNKRQDDTYPMPRILSDMDDRVEANEDQLRKFWGDCGPKPSGREPKVG